MVFIILIRIANCQKGLDCISYPQKLVNITDTSIDRDLFLKIAAEALIGKDEFCGDYQSAFRAQKVEF